LNANEQRAHYDKAYQSGAYRDYKSLPDWAEAMNGYHVDLTIAYLGLRAKDGPVLDLGSGMGYFLDAWESRGFDCIGREISGVVIEQSGRRNIDWGDATDLSGYSDNQFQLVFSGSFLEHVTDAQVDKLLKDELRVAKYAIHFIAHEKGDDAGHINIKPPDEWDKVFNGRVPNYARIPNPLVPVMPCFMHMRVFPPTMSHAYETYFRGNNTVVKHI
jgi:ubiquinone/menaquinone biosynthesis C-methylase UbiE